MLAAIHRPCLELKQQHNMKKLFIAASVSLAFTACKKNMTDLEPPPVEEGTRAVNAKCPVGEHSHPQGVFPPVCVKNSDCTVHKTN